mgnify:CR=1 FL=1
MTSIHIILIFFHYFDYIQNINSVRRVADMSSSTKLLVAAIDFGTTYSGYAFSFKHEHDSDPLKVCSNNWTAGSRSLVSLKTPTCVLFNKDKEFDSFGYEAEDKYSDLAEDEEHQDWFFFKRFKMSLFNKAVGANSNFSLKKAKLLYLMAW